MQGPPEFYFRKPHLKRQRVRARRRFEAQQTTNRKNKITTPRADLFTWLMRPWWPFRKTPVGGGRG